MSKKKINLKRGTAEKLSSTSVSKDNSKKSTTTTKTTKTENTTKKDPMENFVGPKRQTKKVNVTSEPTVNPFKGYTGKSAKSQREDFAKAAEAIRKDLNIIPSLSMVDESATASTGNRTTGSIASTAKKGSTRKIEKEVAQNYSNGSYESTNDRIRRNSNEKLIDEYESIPSYGLGERIVDRDKKQAYDKKQTMYGNYKKALKENYGKALSDLGFTEDDLYAAFYPGYGEEVARQQGRKQYEDMQRYSPQAAEEFRAAYDPAVKGEQITSQLRQKIADAGLNVDRAKEYFDVWKQEQDEQATFERGKNDKAGTFVASAIGKPVENIFGTVDYALDYLSGRPIDSQFKEADTMRSGAQSDMSTIPSLLYGAGSSIADILTGLAIGGGAYSAVNQGLAQANSVIDSASERGLTPNKIIAEGIGSGAATAITEMGALGRMQDLIKDAGKSFLAKLGGGAAAEGLQEVFESLINTGIDITLGGKNSELAQDYVSQLKSGVDKETALVNTGKNYAVSLLYDFLGGAIAGGVLTGGGNIINNAINGQNNASENVIPGLEAKAVEQSTDNVIQNAIEQQTAAQAIEQLAQQIPEVQAEVEAQPEVQGESAPIPNEPATIKIAPVEADADYAFTLPEAQAEAVDAQVEQRSAEIANIVGADNFGAMEFTTDNGSRYIASKSTHDGVEYQLSLIDANGDPVSHTEYQTADELANEINNLTWNKDYDYRVLDKGTTDQIVNNEENVNSEPGYLGAVEDSSYTLTPEQQAEFDEYGTFSPDVEETTAEPIDENEPWIVDGQVTRNGENQIRNGKEPKLKSVTDPRYNGQWLGIRQTLTNYDLGKESGARQFSWQIANEINAYLEDGDTQHLENAQTYANYIDNVINPYMQGKTYEHRGRGGKKVTVEEGTQNISGRVRDLINSIVADEKGAILETAPENVQTAIQNIENIKELGTIMLPGDIDRFVGNYKTLLNKLAEGEPVTDEEFTALTNAATEINNNLLQTEQSLTDSTLPEEFTSEYFIENYLEAQNYLDALSREVTGRDIEVNIPSVEPTEEAPAEEIPAFEEEKPRREMAMEANRGTSTNNDNDTDFAEITIDPETGEEDYERGPEDRPEVGENWGKRYRGAVYDEEGNMKVSQAARNTLYDAPSVQENPELQEKMLEYEDEGRFGAEVSHNAESAEKAQEIVDNSDDIKKTLEDILSENMTFDEMNTVQQDTLMKGVDRMLNEAAESGDFTGVAEILEQTVSRQHKIGQLLQALAKYTHTAASAVTKATTMIHDATEDYTKKHKKQAATNGKLARALETMGNKYADRTTPKQPISHEEMLKRVRNTLEKESASVDELLTDNVIEQITALVESDIPMWQLRDELEHFLNNGEFYTIDESTEQKQAKSQKLANALREVTEGKQERVVNEKTIAQIKQEVRTLINTEYYSISDEFDDDDIDFLANRIYNGAESQELVDALNQKLATGSLGYTEEELAEVVQLYNEVNSGLLTSREEYEAMNKANAILAKHLGHGTLMDRMNQWRYLSMLSSPSTHIKNIASNAAWSTVTMFKDTLAAGMEAAAQAAGADIERTKSVILPTKKDRALVAEAYKSFDRDVYAEYARGGSKYNDRNEIKQQQQVGSRLVNRAAEINSGLLEREDIFAGRMKYTQALAGYLKANGADASIFNSTDPEDRALIKKGEEYALAEANKATFHEENKTAQVLSQFSRSTAEGGRFGLNAVVEGLIPFKKTTANIAKQFTVEYNPVIQLPKAILQTIQNNGNVAETIDSYAKGLTGAGLVALGAYLASQGMLVSTGDNDDKDDVLGQAENFAITWFDKEGKQHYYTIDGIAPTAMLMCVGAELVEDGHSLDAIFDIGDSFIENSLLSGIKNMWEDISYATYDKDKSIPFTIAANMANNYVSQYIPTLSGKFARSIDKTRRSTYTGKKGDMDTLYRYGKKIMNKIPGLSMLNEPYVDTYGNEEKNVGGNFASRLLYNLTSIGYYSKREHDEIQQTIANLDKYAQTLEGDARDEMEKQLTDLITSPDKSYNGERLSPEDYSKYSKITGQKAVEVFSDLVGSDIFQELSPEDQSALMDDMGLFARDLAKREMFGEGAKKYDKWNELYSESNKDVDTIVEYMTIKAGMEGKTSNAAAVAAVEASDLSIEDKNYYLSKFISEPSEDAQAAMDALGENGLYYWYTTAGSSQKKEEQYDAIRNSGLSDEIKSELAKIVYNSGKEEPTPDAEIPSLEQLEKGITNLDGKTKQIMSDRGEEGVVQYNTAKENIKSSADSLGVSTGSTSAQIQGLSDMDMDDDSKGYYLKNLKGSVSKKALSAASTLGDAGIYYWYSIFTEAQEATGKKSPNKTDIKEAINNSNYPDDVKEALLKANDTK